MRFNIITIFPKIFDSYFNESIIKRAQEKGKIKIRTWNLRDFAIDKKHQKSLPAKMRSFRRVDDKPYGGGAGMVLMAEPILRTIQKIKPSKKSKIIVLSAKGKQFTQKMAYDWSKKFKNFIFITGRYEGIDERVTTILHAEEISIGPYIATDGDVGAMVIISALTRLIPNVINWSSLEDESFLRKNIRKETKIGELEYPHYTRPEILKHRGKQFKVPKILLSGNHKKIEEWREKHRK